MTVLSTRCADLRMPCIAITSKDVFERTFHYGNIKYVKKSPDSATRYPFSSRDSGRAGACAGRRFGEQSPGNRQAGLLLRRREVLQRGGRAIHVGSDVCRV